MNHRSILMLLAFFACDTITVMAQKEDHVWLYGLGLEQIDPPEYYGGADINFNYDTPRIVHSRRKTNFGSANASICNTDGNLLFYTNGVYVGDSTYNIMKNGSDLHQGHHYGLGIPQGVLILPIPKDPYQYILFHVEDDRVDVGGGQTAWVTTKLYYSIIDMSLNGGKGQVTEKKVTLISDTLSIGLLTACRHGNGQDWWILVSKNDSNVFYSILLSSLGIQETEKIYAADKVEYGIGQVAFTPDGDKYVSIKEQFFFQGYYIDIIDFDRCSGEFANSHVHFHDKPNNDTSGIVGTAISSNSRFLYLIERKYIHQYDLEAHDIKASRELVATYDGFVDTDEPKRNNVYTKFHFGQLAPDGKIYISPPQPSYYLTVINSPNERGVACDVQQHSIRLPVLTDRTCPNFPNFRLGPLPGSQCDTLTHSDYPNAVHCDLRVFPNPASEILSIRVTSCQREGTQVATHRY